MKTMTTSLPSSDGGSWTSRGLPSAVNRARSGRPTRRSPSAPGRRRRARDGSRRYTSGLIASWRRRLRRRRRRRSLPKDVVAGSPATSSRVTVWTPRGRRRRARPRREQQIVEVTEVLADLRAELAPRLGGGGAEDAGPGRHLVRVDLSEVSGASTFQYSSNTWRAAGAATRLRGPVLDQRATTSGFSPASAPAASVGP